MLVELGVDSIIAYPTDEKLLNLTDREFFDEIVVGKLAARAMVEGPNFFFGRGRTGTIDVLRTFTAAAGMALEVVEPVVAGGEIVSSSRVRKLLAAGQVDELPRPAHAALPDSRHGDARGRPRASDRLSHGQCQRD